MLTRFNLLHQDNQLNGKEGSILITLSAAGTGTGFRFTTLPYSVVAMSTRKAEASLWSCTASSQSLSWEAFWYMWLGTMYALVLSSPHCCKGQNLRSKLTSGDCVYVLPLGATSLYALVKIRMRCRLNAWNALNYFITTHLFLYHVPQWLGLHGCCCARP